MASRSLKELLDDYNLATLVVIMNYHGLKLGSSRPKDVVLRALHDLFIDPAWTRLSLEKLTKNELAVLQIIQRKGGRADRAEIEREVYAQGLADRPAYSGKGVAQPKFDPYQPSGRSLPDILARLQLLGLVVGDLHHSKRPPSDTKLSFKPEEGYIIPEVILERLPPPPPAPPPPKLPTLEVERVQESSARVFQRELFLYWNFVHEAPIRLVGKGYLNKKSLTALNQVLLQREEIRTGQSEGDFPRLYFLRHLAIHLGLLVEDGQSLEATELPSFLELPPDERLKRTFDAFINGGVINELAWYPNLKIPSYAKPPLPTPERIADARRVLLLHLKRAVDGWTSLRGLIDLIRNLDYEFLFPRSFVSAYAPYYASYQLHPYVEFGNPLGWNFTDVKDEASGWEQVEARFIADVVRRSLFWMGLVDLGYSRSDLAEADAFRLTAAGAWLLGVGPAPEIPVEGGRVIVQPNFQIMAFDPVNDAVLVNLSRFAERVASERVTEFRLTRASVYAAQKSSWDASRIQAYLQSLTGAPLPENVARTLEEWQALHERIRVYPSVRLVHSAGPADLDYLFAHPDLKTHLGRRFDPRLAQIKPGSNLNAFARLLYRHDRLPLVHTRGRRPTPRSVRLVEEAQALHLRFRNPHPDLYLHGHLAPFALPEEGGYRLTAESLRRAAAGGVEAPQIIEALEMVLDGPLPESAARRIRAWSRYYGNAVLEETFLLELENETVLKELLEDSEVGSLLKPLSPGKVQVVARVSPKDLSRLRPLLEERGIALKQR